MIENIIPICTNLRYDGTNEELYFDIGEIRRQKLPGEIIVYSDDKIIHNLKFKNICELPAGYSFPYKHEKESETIIAKLILKDKTAMDKLILNEETVRRPMSWEEWRNMGK
jgi:hypothetical protein